MKGALGASIVLALGRAADRGELPIGAVGAYCTNPLAYEDCDGPLARLVYIAEFVVNLVVTGTLTADQEARVLEIARNCRIARALAGDLVVHEENRFSSLAPDQIRSRDLEILQQVRGEVSSRGVEAKATPASAKAEYLSDGRALVTWSGSSQIVTDSGQAAAVAALTPESLLAASLAACTTVFTARAARSAQADVDIRIDCEGTFGGEHGSPGEISKIMQVSGDLDQSQRDVMAFSADRCALGETLRRQSTITINLQCIPAGDSGDARPANSIETVRAAMEQAQDPDCDDGACCVPQLQTDLET